MLMEKNNTPNHILLQLNVSHYYLTREHEIVDPNILKALDMWLYCIIWCIVFREKQSIK